MVVPRPEPLILHDKRAQAMLFDLIAAGYKFEFDDMLATWFDGHEFNLASFLAWLDVHGLEIRKKNA